MMYNCLIVDDEPLARKIIEKYLPSFPQIALQGSVGDAVAAFELLHTQDIHLLFLDIQMPSINGLQFIRSIKNPPAVIFTTAYSEYAAESYNLDAIDYLVKPVSFERFERSVNKFLETIPVVSVEPNQFLLVKHESKLTKVFFNEILYVESRKDYLMIYTIACTYIKHMTMKSIEALLPPQQFKRVHRSFIVATESITGMYNNALEVNKEMIPIGEKYKKEVIAFYRGNNKSR